MSDMLFPVDINVTDNVLEVEVQTPGDCWWLRDLPQDVKKQKAQVRIRGKMKTLNVLAWDDWLFVLSDDYLKVLDSILLEEHSHAVRG